MASKDSLLNHQFFTAGSFDSNLPVRILKGRFYMNNKRYDRQPEFAQAVSQEMHFEDLNLSDFALFLSVMKHKRAHENVLSIIMNEPDLKLRQVRVEEVILNKHGKRGIRLDAWAVSDDFRHFATEMQNDTDTDDMRKRSRYYQGLLDSPLLKAGKYTKYKELPSTFVTFITQEDLFGKNVAMYTFTERCREFPELELNDGTTKFFLNMASKNGRDDLVSLLQYMKKSTLDNPDILVQDQRIVELDGIVTEVKQSSEWEDAHMSILSRGIELGKIYGTIEAGRKYHVPEEQILQDLCEEFQLDKKSALEYLQNTKYALK